MQVDKSSIIIGIDFDGTCVTHQFPSIGKEIGANFVLKTLAENGHQLILWTMRCNHISPPKSDDPDIILIDGNYLTEAEEWFHRHTIPLYASQINPTQHTWTHSPKLYSHYLIDDSAIGTPLLLYPEISSRPFVNWFELVPMLWKKRLITTAQTISLRDEIEDFFNLNYNINII